MNIERFVEEAFKSDGKLRYVGVVDDRFHVLTSRMREGEQSLTSNDSDRNFIQIMPPIIVDSVEKLQPFLGNLVAMTVRYEKVLLVFYRLGKLVVVLSFSPEVATPFITKTSELYKELGELYLTR